MATPFPIAPCPARIRPKAPIFTRGSSHDRFAKYSEEGAAYQDNMQRLLRKFETAKSLVPAPDQARGQGERTRYGVIYFGSTARRHGRGAGQRWRPDGLHLDTLRLRAFPFAEEVVDFINAHDQVFIVEQNRDAQMRIAAGQRMRHRSGALHFHPAL